MIKLIGYITLIAIGVWSGIIQAILMFSAAILTFAAGFLSGGVI